MYPTNPVGTRYGKRSGKRWASNTSQAALRDIRERAVVDLKTRDERVSHGRLSSDNGYQPYELDTDDPARAGEDPVNRHYVINSELVKIRHKGHELTALFKSRWAKFCAEPRDETQLDPLSITRNRVIARNIEEGEAIEATLGVVGETMAADEPAEVVVVGGPESLAPGGYCPTPSPPPENESTTRGKPIPRPAKRRGRPFGSKNKTKGG